MTVHFLGNCIRHRLARATVSLEMFFKQINIWAECAAAPGGKKCCKQSDASEAERQAKQTPIY